MEAKVLCEPFEWEDNCYEPGLFTFYKDGSVELKDSSMNSRKKMFRIKK